MISSKKNVLIRRIVIASLLSLTFLVVGCYEGAHIVSDDKTASDSLVDKVIKTLKDEWYSEIFYKDVSDEDALIAQFVSSITNLDTSKQLDPYTYITKKNTNTSEVLGKMGITITNTFDYPVVTKIEKNSPADGILAINDIIYGIGKEDANGNVTYHYISEDDYGYSSLIKYGEGLVGDKTYVKYVRLDNDGIYQKDESVLTLGSISNNTYTYVEDYDVADTLFVKITGFNVGNNTDYTASQFASILENNEGYKNLVIDLRDNGGGALESVINVCDLFLPKDKIIVSLEKKDGSVVNYQSSDDNLYSFDRYIILQNGSTASASEILIKAMQYYFKDNLTLIGSKTFGKGIAQRSISLNQNYSMQYTFAKWLAPDGSYIEYKDGINADVALEKSTLLKTMQNYYYALCYNENNKMQYDTVSNNNIYFSRILKEKGYDLRTDGYIDKNYEDVIKEFQKNHQIEQTGIVDENTFFYLVGDFINEKASFDDSIILEVSKTLS